MLQAIVFDFDGVLANSEPLHLQVYQRLLGDEGIAFSADEYYTRYLGFDDVGIFEALARDRGLRIDGRMASLIARKTRIFQALVVERSVLFPAAPAVLRACAAAVPIAIASGALREEIDLVLEAADLAPLVPVIVAAGDTPAGKPAPDPYRRALELLAARHDREIDPARSVAIEDSRLGLQSARSAGMTTVGVTTSYPAEALYGADLVVPGIEAITPGSLADLVARRGASP